MEEERKEEEEEEERKEEEEEEEEREAKEAAGLGRRKRGRGPEGREKNRGARRKILGNIGSQMMTVRGEKGEEIRTINGMIPMR